MIATLRGQVSEKLLDAVVIEVGGVGYEVVLTAEDFGSAITGTEFSVYIYEAIREDAYNLYGFRQRASKTLFTQLLGISGIGPKVAMSVMSAASIGQLQRAIAGGDAEILRGVAGVGKKTAERIMVELRGKVDIGAGADDPAGASVTVDAADPVYEALIGLGYTAGQAASALSQLEPSVQGDEQRLKAALKHIR